jgi:hypothetical protein
VSKTPVKGKTHDQKRIEGGSRRRRRDPRKSAESISSFLCLELRKMLALK